MNLCECGCGQECKKRFLRGHQIRFNHPTKGKHIIFSEETKKKMRENNWLKRIPREQHPMLGKHHTEEVKRFLSEINKGNIMSEENKRKLLLANKDNKYMLGKHHTEEAKKKMRENNAKPMLGKHHSIETRKKIGDAERGNKYMLGKHHSEETKKRISENHKGKGLGENNPMYGKVPTMGKFKSGWAWVHNIHCQSSYEPRFVEACFKWNVHVERNQKRFYFENSVSGKFTYNPDFYCKDYGLVEIKGCFNNRNLRNLNECKKQDIKILLVFRRQLKEFEQTGVLNTINILENDLSVYPVRKGKNV